jgi:hypothetical protein
MESKLATITNLKNWGCLPQSNLESEAAKHLCELGGWRRTVENTPTEENNTNTTKRTPTNLVLLGACLMFAGVTHVLAQENARAHAQDCIPTPMQIVALDECDPKTFNDALGPDFCNNVTLGKFTVLQEDGVMNEISTSVRRCGAW